MVRVNNKGELYIHQDANWNVIALTDLGGNVVERYVYRPYGEVAVHQETSYGDYDGDQDVDTTDRDALSLPENSPSGAERILDLDFDGDVDSTDTTLFNNNLITGIARHPGRVSTVVEQPFGHQGLMCDPEISSYQNRNRLLASVLRRFLLRDPLGYVDGMNFYEYCSSNPINNVDPMGYSNGDPIDPTWGVAHCVINCIMTSYLGLGNALLLSIAWEVFEQAWIWPSLYFPESIEDITLYNAVGQAFGIFGTSFMGCTILCEAVFGEDEEKKEEKKEMGKKKGDLYDIYASPGRIGGSDNLN